MASINIKQDNLNIRKLDLAMNQYKFTPNYSYESYLILNEDTLKEILRIKISQGYAFCGKTPVTYNGFNIACCETLEYGEIVIK